MILWPIKSECILVAQLYRENGVLWLRTRSSTTSHHRTRFQVKARRLAMQASGAYSQWRSPALCVTQRQHARTRRWAVQNRFSTKRRQRENLTRNGRLRWTPGLREGMWSSDHANRVKPWIGSKWGFRISFRKLRRRVREKRWEILLWRPRKGQGKKRNRGDARDGVAIRKQAQRTCKAEWGYKESRRMEGISGGEEGGKRCG